MRHILRKLQKSKSFSPLMILSVFRCRQAVFIKPREAASAARPAWKTFSISGSENLLRQFHQSVITAIALSGLCRGKIFAYYIQSQNCLLRITAARKFCGFN